MPRRDSLKKKAYQSSTENDTALFDGSFEPYTMERTNLDDYINAWFKYSHTTCPSECFLRPAILTPTTRVLSPNSTSTGMTLHENSDLYVIKDINEKI